MITLEDVWPPYAFTISCGDMSLRVVRDDDLPELIELVLDGIHEPDAMPFSVPWTRVPAERAPAEYARYHWASRPLVQPNDFALHCAVRVGGELVGVQDLGGQDFCLTRAAKTGSWLALRFHGRGIGTRMRQAVCAFGFDVLGATELRSSAFVDNPASLAVSRKVGYRSDGSFVVDREGVAATQQRLLLRPEWLVRAEQPVEFSGTEPLLRFLELAPRDQTTSGSGLAPAWIRP